MALQYRDSTIATNGGVGTGSSVNKPSGTIEGDYLLMITNSNTGSAANLGTPTGGATWTQLGSTLTSTELLVKLWGKRAGSSEPSSYSYSYGSNGRGVAICAAFEGVGEEDLVIASGTSGSGSNVSSPGLTPGGADWLEVRFAIAIPGSTVFATWTPPSGFDEVEDGQDNAFNMATLAIADAPTTSGDPTSTLNFTSSASLSRRAAFTIALPPIASPRRSAIVHSGAVHRAASW